jgi:hypothetical protein
MLSSTSVAKERLPKELTLKDKDQLVVIVVIIRGDSSGISSTNSVVLIIIIIIAIIPGHEIIQSSCPRSVGTYYHRGAANSIRFATNKVTANHQQTSLFSV